ncbi:unnamed protein product [Schistosoma mattheei]|uniref:Uncharacterized protein n=1 Tax=Schistosoma mattheei TaxID=31246 RepID=A0A3P8DVY8_9TREM|nr:unnamed protein product [Schistosoma mattheei]
MYCFHDNLFTTSSFLFIGWLVKLYTDYCNLTHKTPHHSHLNLF